MDEIFPEDSYDPSSGEYSDYDFDPIFTGRVFINSDISAEIQTNVPDFTPIAEDVVSRLQDFVDAGLFDVEGNKNPLNYPLLGTSDFDFQDKNSRGPFPNMFTLNDFFAKSGLRGLVDVWYDDANDEYWVDADTSG